MLLDDKGGPVYLKAWDGQSTIGRALKAIIQADANGAPPLTSFQRVIVTVKNP